MNASAAKQKHPSGLYLLFFTEMWERFGYYLMLGILFLYLTENEKGGLGMDKKVGDDIVGTYLALVYLTPFIGGLIADRLLGYRRSVVIGGTLMGVGYLGLAIPSMTAFWTSLMLIIVGNGFFKPNISTLLGNLYSGEKYKDMKGTGYNIFYMGINIGAFICNFVAAYMKNNYNFRWAFAAAGIGMFVGLAWFIFGSNKIKEADVKKPAAEGDIPVSSVLLYVFLPCILTGLGAMYFIPGNLLGSDTTDGFIFGCIPVIIYFYLILQKSPKEEKQQVSALLAIFLVAIVFWAVFKQNATALTNFARNYTDRTIPESVVPVISPFHFDEKVTVKMDSVVKSDEHFRPVLVNDKKVKEPGYPPYFKNLPKSQWPEEGKSLSLVSTELYQSVNPGWIILFTPLVIAFFAFLRKRKREPSLPAKIGWGLLITGFSSLVMATAVLLHPITAEKVSSLWLIGSYLVVTIGELFLSPIGLTLVSKVSPPRITSLMMVGWFLSTSIGNKLSGVLSSTWDKYDSKELFFFTNFLLCALAALMVLMMVKWLRRVVESHQ